MIAVGAFAPTLASQLLNTPSFIGGMLVLVVWGAREIVQWINTSTTVKAPAVAPTDATSTIVKDAVEQPTESPSTPSSSADNVQGRSDHV